MKVSIPILLLLGNSAALSIRKKLSDVVPRSNAEEAQMKLAEEKAIASYDGVNLANANATFVPPELRGTDAMKHMA
jgi:hypothetical protein